MFNRLFFFLNDSSILSSSWWIRFFQPGQVTRIFAIMEITAKPSDPNFVHAAGATRGPGELIVKITSCLNLTWLGLSATKIIVFGFESENALCICFGSHGLVLAIRTCSRCGHSSSSHCFVPASRNFEHSRCLFSLHEGLPLIKSSNFSYQFL